MASENSEKALPTAKQKLFYLWCSNTTLELSLSVNYVAKW
jgi:hypothetical protein